MPQPNLKTPEEIKLMHEGGKKLSEIKKTLGQMVDVGVSAYEIEEKANEMIEKTGGKASFKMVEGYSWATCVNVNDGVVHGIPKKKTVFEDGDLVSIDIGLFFKGFHTDTSISVLAGENKKRQEFLDVGINTLKSAIATAINGNQVRDISKKMQDGVESHGFSAIRALVGHGIGRQLHEYPPVPCFISGSKSEEVELKQGLVLAIEIMYSKGKPEIVLEDDGWTLGTKDGKIAGLFEETVAITKNGPLVLTE